MFPKFPFTFHKTILMFMSFQPYCIMLVLQSLRLLKHRSMPTWRQSGVGRGGVRPQRLGEAEPVTSVSGEAESAPRGRVRRSPSSEVGRGGAPGLGVGQAGARPQMPGEAKLAHLGGGWRCSHALDYSDESMLMVISSSSLDSLVLVPN